MKYSNRILVLLMLAFVIVFQGCAGKEEKKTSDIVLVIHGGAGTILKKDMTPDSEQQYTSTLAAALEAGYRILNDGGSSLDAVETTIRVMEDSPLFNAGKGAVFTNQGKNELDASIMDGATLQAGAVAAVTTIKNPIAAARKVMTNSKHVLLTGRGAELFAAEQGLEIVDPEYFFEKRRWDALLKARDKTQSSLAPSTDEPAKFGTVGAVALDRAGNLAAGTSTGGLTNKLYGRVGDSPIIGAGTYANNQTCAVSGTGEGEYFMRLLVAYDISAQMEYKGMSLRDAVTNDIKEKLTKLGGEGGVIALDRNGDIAMTFNTPGMYRGYVKSDGATHVVLDGEE
jgi:beta-aspartyl-peptidase (threonine type)